MHEFYDYTNKFKGMSKVDVQVFFWKKNPHKIEFFNTHTLMTTVFIGDISEFSVILRSGLQNIFPMCTKALWIQPESVRKYYR